MISEGATLLDLSFANYYRVNHINQIFLFARTNRLNSIRGDSGQILAALDHRIIEAQFNQETLNLGLVLGNEVTSRSK